jgi:uncharacterized membrane protein
MKEVLIVSKSARISDISKDIAQIFFASLVVSQFVSTERSWVAIAFGMILSLCFWYSSLLLTKSTL